MIPNPYKIVADFENAIAEFCGAPYAVATESCTSAIFLCLMYFKTVVYRYNNKDYDLGRITIPARTYPGVACSIIHAGGKINFQDVKWEGEYQLEPYPIWDAALRFKKGMYHGGFQCLSFHGKKNLPIGRGGIILTEDESAVKWLRRARFDGRNPVPLQDDHFDMLGWNCYLQPEQAARGLMLLQALLSKDPDGSSDLVVSEQGYPDLSKFNIYAS